MQKLTFILCLLFMGKNIFAHTVSGIVKDDKGNLLPYSSIIVKGTAKGTTANSKGRYSLQLPSGEYILVCLHVGFQSVEKKIKVKEDKLVDFELKEQQYQLKEVVVKNGGEDPAYEIIRNAIRKREEYLNEMSKFQCEVYIKGQLQLRNYPDKFFGRKVDFEDGDTSKRKIIFLSETLANYSVDGNNKKKIEVVSTKVSGQSDGFGFSNPQVISFYENSIPIGRGLNPRGFVSPIAANALNFYKYKFEGTFFENGQQVSRIKVIPRRKYEPLFSGYVNIIEDEWRLQSVQLTLLKEQQMQLLDTLKIEQLYVPMKDRWVIKQQVIYPAGKIFNFDFFGNFVQVYDKFDIAPDFKKKFFDHTLFRYNDSSNKKSLAYWDSIRPVPLLETEIKDYQKKDSLEQERKKPGYLDSLDRIRNKISFTRLMSIGYEYSKEKKKISVSFDPLVNLLNNYNTVEGYVIHYAARINKEYGGGKSLSLGPTIRYGFSNKHFNAYLSGQYNSGKKYANSFSFAGGQKVFQFNNANPIAPFNNTVSTLYWTRNYMKLYEAGFLAIGYGKGLGNGLSISASVEYQDRKPLENTTGYNWRKVDGRAFTPNYPVEISASNIIPHKAFIATASLTWRPGAKYIEFPDRRFTIGSKYPTFNVSLTQGVQGLLGSGIDYTKWHFNLNGNLNLKLGGRISYRLEAGGFINANTIFLPDYQHYSGNQTAVAGQYLNSFQLLPYYQFSNTEKLYTAGHIEYHLNGLLSNKIPGFKKFNWFFVLGANVLYINSSKNYYEAFFSIENIFKIIRVDFVQGYLQNRNTASGIRFAFPLLFKGN